jgi:phospholipid/cholesterol/gamma-HCH transport system substrate-binding protein
MKKYALETTAGIFVLVGLLSVGYMTVKLGRVSLFGDSTYLLFAQFTSVSGLRPGSSVTMYGLDIGQVAKFTMDQQKGLALVEMEIHRGIRIYDDAIASIKTEGLIGDRYVSIDPGGAGAVLKPGGTITDTQPPVDLNELIGKYAFGEVKK